MNDRRKVLELFDEQEASWKQRSAEGIERYRKGNGRAEFRGFYGDYSAVISSSEEVIGTKISLSKTSENSFDIIL